MKRGTIVWVNLSDAHPPEMDKVRPGLILSNSVVNARLETVVIVPLSTQAGEIWPLRIKVSAGGKKQSFAILPGLRQVSKRRLLDATGMLSGTELRRLDRAVGEYLTDESPRAI